MEFSIIYIRDSRMGGWGRVDDNHWICEYIWFCQPIYENILLMVILVTRFGWWGGGILVWVVITFTITAMNGGFMLVMKTLFTTLCMCAMGWANWAAHTLPGSPHLAQHIPAFMACPTPPLTMSVHTYHRRLTSAESVMKVVFREDIGE